ncbi:unnamed protein product [Coffea canephora]|uniref:Expansin-like EG45 domain-containing protein n=1 Tax=Coffea canephora TaxID=49390 RepID=A0A068UAY0_COFCA|nr:unnamed protein product [Coffea canephora]
MRSKPNYFSLFISCVLLGTCCFSNPCYCFKPKNFTLSTIAARWSSAGATWYGSPNGAGSDGGACGYGNLVSQAPFSSLVTGIGPSLYNAGKECGACYQVKCTKHPACSGQPVRVVITDFCPGYPCTSGPAHFDLSGTAFGAMAVPGKEQKLRDAGVLEISYARSFEDGDGDLAGVALKQSSGRDEWWEMKQSSQYSGQILVAKNVIPAGWKPGATYRSLVKYL